MEQAGRHVNTWRSVCHESAKRILICTIKKTFPRSEAARPWTPQGLGPSPLHRAHFLLVLPSAASSIQGLSGLTGQRETSSVLKGWAWSRESGAWIARRSMCWRRGPEGPTTPGPSFSQSFCSQPDIVFSPSATSAACSLGFPWLWDRGTFVSGRPPSLHLLLSQTPLVHSVFTFQISIPLPS